jgi:uroporphyrinogen III methyltransferase/synthase
VITRAHEAGGAFAAGLRALGAEVTEFPVIEIVAPDSYAAIDAALARVTSFDWMIFTSASGVERMLERMTTRGVGRDWPRDRRASGRPCANGCRDAARVSR